MGCTQLLDATVDSIEIISFNPIKEKHVFVPPVSHELALSTVEQLKRIQEELVAKGGLVGAERLSVKQFLDDRVGPFLEIYVQKAREPDKIGQMREMALRAGGRFCNIYLDTLQKTKDDDPQGDKAFVSMANELRKHCSAVETRKLRLRQETNDVVELFHHAIVPHEMLKRFAMRWPRHLVGMCPSLLANVFP